MKVAMEFTSHAIDRLDGRMSKLVKVEEVVKAAARPLPIGKSTVEVKRLPTCVEIKDETVKPDGVAKGDQIVAIINNFGTKYVIITIALRKSWSKSSLPEYQKIF